VVGEDAGNLNSTKVCRGTKGEATFQLPCHKMTRPRWCTRLGVSFSCA